MPDTIEVAKSGRAACRTCKEKIEKDALRFGHEVKTQFSPDPSMQWHHLPCAAKKLPAELKAAIDAYAGEVPDRDGLLKTIEESKGKEKPTTLPYADRAPTGRAKCMACGQAIEKAAFRVAVERDLEMGQKAAGYLHPACVLSWAEENGAPEDLVAQIEQHSHLSAEELAKVKVEIEGDA